MSALQKLKAYFGMVPADELDEYDDDRYSGYGSAYQAGEPDFDTYSDRLRRRPLSTPRPVSRLDAPDDYDDDRTRPPRRSSWTSEPPHRTVPPVRGALAVEPQVEPVARPRPAPAPVDPAPAAHPLSRITTLHPRSFVDARTIGERYRDGAPVIINLTDLSDSDARRLVDFAAGLAFAMRGDIDKITNKVFLISPPNIDVTAEDRRRLAEGGVFG
ncbi:MAG TPA: cell division protein SepF [Pseudonocardiaceae bacterium]|jgi:cell division inhibitor SepF|nr:cell division protein SepF [Pseudonocardiaceae bacterium]